MDLESLAAAPNDPRHSPDLVVSAGTHAGGPVNDFVEIREDMDDVTQGINYIAPGATSPVHDVLVDFHTDIEAIQRQFKDRYSTLKKIYEDRLKNLSNQVRQTYTAVVKDEAIAAMQQSDLTSPFIFERAQEIAEAGLDSEREQSFQTIAKDLAKKDADIKHLKRENERLARQLEAAQREADKVSPLEASLRETKRRLQVAVSRHREDVEKHGAEAKEVEVAINTLRQTIGGEPVTLPAAANANASVYNTGNSAFTWDSFVQTPSASNIRRGGGAAVGAGTANFRESLLHKVLLAEKKLHQLDGVEGKTDPSTGKSVEEARESLIEQLAEAQDQLHLFDRNSRRNIVVQPERRRKAIPLPNRGQQQQQQQQNTRKSSDSNNRTSLDITREVEQQVSLQREMELTFRREKADMEEQFETRMQQILSDRDMTNGRIGNMHKEIVDKMKNETRQVNSKYLVLKEKAKEIKSQLKRTKAELLENKKLLSQSEKERLELRRQYLTIGEKMEGLVTTENEVRINTEEKYREKVKRAKAKLHESATRTKQLVREHRDKMADLVDELKDKENEIREKNSELERVLNEVAEMKVELAKAHEKIEVNDGIKSKIVALQTQLTMTKNRLEDEPSRVDEAVRQRSETYERRISEMQLDIAKLEGDLKLQRQLEDQKHKHVELERDKIIDAAKHEMQSKYQGLIQAKLKELADAQAHARELNAQAKDRENGLRQKVNQRLEEITRDHITVAQHEEVLRAKMNELRMEMKGQQRSENARKHTDLSARLSDKGKELESNFRVAENRMQEQLINLETEKIEEQEKRVELENQSAADRKILIEFQHKVEQEKKVNEGLVTHLEEASRNITHLKQMLDGEMKRAQAAETALVKEKSLNGEHNDRVARLYSQLEESVRRNEKLYSTVQHAHQDLLVMAKSSAKISYGENELNQIVNEEAKSAETSDLAVAGSPSRRGVVSEAEECITRRGLANRVAAAEQEIIEHDIRARHDLEDMALELQDGKHRLVREQQEAKELLASSKNEQRLGLTEDDDSTVETQLRLGSGDLLENILSHTAELKDIDEKIKNTTFLEDAAEANDERIAQREKLKDLRALRFQTSKDLETMKKNIADRRGGLQQAIMDAKTQKIKDAELAYFEKKVELSKYLASMTKAILETRSRKNEERKFLRGRFLAGVTDLKAHDEATMAGIVLERKQTLMKQSIKQQHDAQRHYLDNIRVIEHELNDFKLKTGKELEEIKRYGMANIEAAQSLKTQTDTMLAQFDKAVQAAAFSAEANAGGPNSFLSPSDPSQRTDLEAKGFQFEQEVAAAKAKYNADVQKKENAILVGRKTFLRRLDQARAEHARYESKLEKDEQSEMQAIMQRIGEYEFDLCGRFLDLDQSGTAALQTQSIDLRNRISEHKTATQEVLVDIHDAKARLQIAEHCESSLMQMQQALKDVDDLVEERRKDSARASMMFQSNRHFTMVSESTNSVLEEDFPVDPSARNSLSNTGKKNGDGAKLREESEKKKLKALSVEPLEKQFELLSKNVTRIRHALMDETARRNIVEQFLQKNRTENCELRKRIDALRQSTNRDHDKEAELEKKISKRSQNLAEQKKASDKLARELSEQKSRFNRMNMKLDSSEREKVLLERTKSRMEKAIASLTEERDQQKTKLETQAAERDEEKKKLTKMVKSIKEMVAMKDSEIGRLRESKSKVLLQSKKMLYTTVRSMKDNLTRVRAQSISEIDKMRNDIYKYVRDMQWKFRSVLSAIHGANQEDMQRAFKELREQFSSDTDRLNKSHREEITRMQDMHTAAIASVEKHAESTKQSSVSDIARLESQSSSQFQEQINENGKLQTKNNELHLSLSQCQSRVAELQMALEACNVEKAELSKQVTDLKQSIRREEESRRKIREEMKSLGANHRLETIKITKQVNNFVGTLISLSAHINLPKELQDKLLSDDQSTYSTGLQEMQSVISAHFKNSTTASQKRITEEAKNAAIELKDKLSTTIKLHEADVSALKDQLHSVQNALKEARMDEESSLEMSRKLEAQLALEKQETRVLKTEVEQVRQSAQVEIEGIKSQAKYEKDSLQASMNADKRLNETQTLFAKDSLEKTLEVERAKLREERARRMSEIDAEKAAIQLKMEAERAKFQMQMEEQQKALKARAAAQRKELDRQKAEYEMLNKLALETSRTESATEFAASQQTLARLEMENNQLKRSLASASSQSSEQQLQGIRAKYQDEISVLKKKNELDHKKMRILRSELVQQANEADRLINSERAKLNVVLSRHSMAESRIAELTKEMNNLRSSVANMDSGSSDEGQMGQHSRVHITRTGSVHVNSQSDSASQKETGDLTVESLQ